METVDKRSYVENLQVMPTISAHLPAPVYKRLRAHLGRKRGASAFIRMAVEKELSGERVRQSTPEALRIAAEIQEILEDERDIRIAEERLDRLDRGESKTYTGEEVWRALGLQD